MRRGERREHAGGNGIRVAGGRRSHTQQARRHSGGKAFAQRLSPEKSGTASTESLASPESPAGAESLGNDGGSTMADRIVIKGAREHNLKNIDLEIPRDRLVVITGLSGSGKSSLAFDTIYAEGQRRYVESLSAYARQFLEQMEKPDIDSIEGLSPAISIEQKTTS